MHKTLWVVVFGSDKAPAWVHLENTHAVQTRQGNRGFRGDGHPDCRSCTGEEAASRALTGDGSLMRYGHVALNVESWEHPGSDSSPKWWGSCAEQLRIVDFKEPPSLSQQQQRSIYCDVPKPHEDSDGRWKVYWT